MGSWRRVGCRGGPSQRLKKSREHLRPVDVPGSALPDLQTVSNDENQPV